MIVVIVIVQAVIVQALWPRWNELLRVVSEGGFGGRIGRMESVKRSDDDDDEDAIL